jgi:hypothetical protein
MVLFSYIMNQTYEFCVIYFLRDKKFAIYPLDETSWNCNSQIELNEKKRKIQLTADYDGVCERIILVQLGKTEEELQPALKYAMLLKTDKNLPIEKKILCYIQRTCPEN